MADAHSRRWTRRFSVTIVTTLLLQVLLPVMAALAIYHTVPSRGDDHRTILTMIVAMGLQGVVPLVGMLVLMTMGLRRARRVGEGGLFKTLLVLACLASIPFYVIMVLSIPFAPPTGIATRIVGALAGSGFGFLIVLCLSLRDDQPWMPRHPRIAMTIGFLSVFAMTVGILGRFAPLLMSIGPVAGFFRLLNVFLVPALAWSVLIDRTTARSGWFSAPQRAVPVMAGLAVLWWQVATPTSTMHRIFTPRSHAYATTMERIMDGHPNRHP